MQSEAKTVDEYLLTLPDDRAEIIAALRNQIRKNLPRGFEETMQYGMISYVVPHKLYPAGYHCKPTDALPFISIASQKNIDDKLVKGNKKFVITNIEMLNADEQIVQLAESGKDLLLKLYYQVKEKGPDPIVIVKIKNNLEQILFTCLSRNSYNGIMQLQEQGSITCVIPKLPLLSGLYTVDITLKYSQDLTFDLENIFSFEVERGDFFGTGKINADMMNGMIIYHNWKVE